MRVGIIGSGRIGGTLAFLVARIGHDVRVGSRNPATRVALEARLAGRGKIAGIDDAAEFGDLVILAAPWAAAFAGDALPAPERCQGKIVVDAMNPFRPGGGLFDLGGATSTEIIAGRLPGARVVKAFNTIRDDRLAGGDRADASHAERQAIFVAANDAEAKAVVLGLIEELGFAAVDTGSLADGRLQEPGQPLFNRPVIGSEAEQLLAELKVRRLRR
jgi:8-hydroxy-5-deazaflavin:NADPH oxidoreductase